VQIVFLYKTDFRGLQIKKKTLLMKFLKLWKKSETLCIEGLKFIYISMKQFLNHANGQKGGSASASKFGSDMKNFNHQDRCADKLVIKSHTIIRYSAHPNTHTPDRLFFLCNIMVPLKVFHIIYNLSTTYVCWKGIKDFILFK
jgi:hypothetical protein